MTRKFQYFNPLWYIYVYFNPLWYSIVYSYMMLFLVNSLHRMKKQPTDDPHGSVAWFQTGAGLTGFTFTIFHYRIYI